MLANIQNIIINDMKYRFIPLPYARETPINAEVKVIDNDSGTLFLCAIMNMAIEILSTISIRTVEPVGKSCATPVLKKLPSAKNPEVYPTIVSNIPLFFLIIFPDIKGPEETERLFPAVNATSINTNSRIIKSSIN